jgi:hypothetical protein
VFLGGVFYEGTEYIHSTVGCKMNVFFHDYSKSGAYVPISLNYVWRGSKGSKPLFVGSFGLGYQRLLNSSFVAHVEGGVSLSPYTNEIIVTIATVSSRYVETVYDTGAAISAGLGYRF